MTEPVPDVPPLVRTTTLGMHTVFPPFQTLRRGDRVCTPRFKLDSLIPRHCVIMLMSLAIYSSLFLLINRHVIIYSQSAIQIRKIEKQDVIAVSVRLGANLFITFPQCEEERSHYLSYQATKRI